MKFIKATTRDGQVEFFNLNNILSISPYKDTAKILMGAGLYWTVYIDSMAIIEINGTGSLDQIK